jgi:hypothetical protein
MIKPSPGTESPAIAAARAVRFGFAAIVLGMSYPSIHFALVIPRFAQIYQDMLGARPLPVATTWILQFRPFLLGLSILIPLAAISVIFAGGLTRSIYISGGLILTVFFQLYFTWHALSAPLFDIVSAMGGTARGG